MNIIRTDYNGFIDSKVIALIRLDLYRQIHGKYVDLNPNVKGCIKNEEDRLVFLSEDLSKFKLRDIRYNLESKLPQTSYAMVGIDQIMSQEVYSEDKVIDFLNSLNVISASFSYDKKAYEKMVKMQMDDLLKYF